MRRFLAAMCAILVVAGLGVVWFVRELNPPGGPGAAVQVVLPKGSNTKEIGNLLESAGVIPSASAFGVYVRLKGFTGLRAGRYQLHRNMAVSAVISILRAGPTREFARLVIPEGLTLEQIAQRVGKIRGRDAGRFLEIARSGVIRSRIQPQQVSTLEGLLFPDTYYISPEEDETAIIERMIGRFEQVAEEVGLIGTPGAPRDPYRAVIVASMIEAEAKVGSERPLIAAVIFNRLRISMKLQIDATVLYSLGRHKASLTNNDLKVDSAYNTYRVPGLPPTPIAAPGKAALAAAVSPAKVPYLYYVLVDRSGKHGFTESAAEFEKWKADSQRRGVF